MITNWDQLPLVLKVEHMAALQGVDVSTVWKRCRKRTQRPKPVDWEKPWEWNRDVVRAQYEAGNLRMPVGRPSRRRPLQRAREAFAAIAVNPVRGSSSLLHHGHQRAEQK